MALKHRWERVQHGTTSSNQFMLEALDSLATQLFHAGLCQGNIRRNFRLPGDHSVMACEEWILCRWKVPWLGPPLVEPWLTLANLGSIAPAIFLKAIILIYVGWGASRNSIEILLLTQGHWGGCKDASSRRESYHHGCLAKLFLSRKPMKSLFFFAQACYAILQMQSQVIIGDPCNGNMRGFGQCNFRAFYGIFLDLIILLNSWMVFWKNRKGYINGFKNGRTSYSFIFHVNMLISGHWFSVADVTVDLIWVDTFFEYINYHKLINSKVRKSKNTLENVEKT